jgi:ABC-2 type transport system permease protein
MLLLTLVAGPFLILFFFGLGFRNEPQSLKTRFVVNDINSPLAREAEQYGQTLGGQLIYKGLTEDRDDAMSRLAAGEFDLVVVVPEAPFEQIREEKQAVFELYHRELNPIQAGYVDTFGRVYVDEVNRRILQYITRSGQIDARKVEDVLVVVRTNINSLQDALNECADALEDAGKSNTCDRAAVEDLVQEVDHAVDELRMELGEDAGNSDAAQRWLQGDTSGNLHKELEPTLNRLTRNTNKLEDAGNLQKEADLYLEQVEELTHLEDDLDIIQERLQEFVDIQPWLLVSPFSSSVSTPATVISATVTDYYGPAVIAMLLQHLTVTFAALSLVRERQLGSIELFTVSLFRLWKRWWVNISVISSLGFSWH